MALRGAIVGFGEIAMGHAHGYADSEGLDVVAVVDCSPQRRHGAEREFGLPAYANLDALLRHESIDFLDICAPPDAHITYAVAALDKGIHVICEKPVFPSVTGSDFERLGELLGTSDAVLYPAHNYKFAPILTAMREICASPQFGRVVSARFRTLRAGHAVGVPEWHPHWRRDVRVSRGGIIMDHGPHSIYMALLLTGGTPLRVSCVAGTMRFDEYADTEDTALLRIHCDNGSLIDLDLTWAAGFRSSYYSVVGSGGLVTVDNDDIQYALNGTVFSKKIKSDFDDSSHREWFRQLFHDFREVVEKPERQWALIREAWITSAVIEAAYRSTAKNGAWVDVDEAPRNLQRVG